MSKRMMEDRVVIVTGAGRGIGREIALQMARHGAKVVINDVGATVTGDASSEDPAQEVADLIRSEGGQAVINRDSVAEWGGAQHMAQAAMDNFGRVDCVVNNAGILRDRMFHQMSWEEWESVLRVHLSGSFNVSRAVAPHFKAQQSGAFVHMTSTAGLIGNMGQANYAAAKMGIVGLSKSIALDMARFNVRSNCISPFAWSRMVGNIPETPDQAERIAKVKTMTPDTIAPLAVLLASDAAAEINAQIFVVRRNEIFLMSQPRPTRSMHRSEGWTPETLASHLVPAFSSSLVPFDRGASIFNWDPV